MKKTAFTLIELAITMVLSGILILVMTCQFVALINFNKMTEYSDGSKKESAVAVREARIVMEHMTNVLRFAKPSTFAFNDAEDEASIAVDIEGGHRSMMPNTKTCYYWLNKSSNTLYFLIKGSAEEVISKNVTYLCTVNASDAIWDPINKLLILRLIFSDNQTTVPIQTTVKVLGD